MPPYLTLGLVARKALPRSRAAKRNIDFIHTGCKRLPGGDATPNPPERQERRVTAARHPTAGRSCLAKRAAIGTARSPVRREGRANGTSWWISSRAEAQTGRRNCAVPLAQARRVEHGRRGPPSSVSP